jgi:hypothetical protein
LAGARGEAAHDERENSRHLWPDAGNDRYDLAVANLRVAPVSSIGGNLCFADPSFVSLTLLIAVGTPVPRQKASESCRKPDQRRHVARLLSFPTFNDALSAATRISEAPMPELEGKT